jgi:hypothetical protein
VATVVHDAPYDMAVERSSYRTGRIVAAYAQAPTFPARSVPRTRYR